MTCQVQCQDIINKMNFLAFIHIGEASNREAGQFKEKGPNRRIRRKIHEYIHRHVGSKKGGSDNKNSKSLVSFIIIEKNFTVEPRTDCSAVFLAFVQRFILF